MIIPFFHFLLNQCFASVTLGLNSQVTENAHLSEQSGVVVTLQTFMGNVLGSNLGWDTGSTDLHRFPQSRQAAVGTLWPRQVPSTSMRLRHSSVIFDVMHSETLINYAIDNVLRSHLQLRVISHVTGVE